MKRGGPYLKDLCSSYCSRFVWVFKSTKLRSRFDISTRFQSIRPALDHDQSWGWQTGGPAHGVQTVLATALAEICKGIIWRIWTRDRCQATTYIIYSNLAALQCIISNTCGVNFFSASWSKKPKGIFFEFLFFILRNKNFKIF